MYKYYNGCFVSEAETRDEAENAACIFMDGLEIFSVEIDVVEGSGDDFREGFQIRYYETAEALEEDADNGYTADVPMIVTWN